MKLIAPVSVCLAIAGCGQAASEVPTAPDLPGASATPSARQASGSPAGSAAIVVPVEDDNPLNIPPAVYPSLPVQFADAASVTPGGWRIEHRVEGDLDGDQRADLVLVLREQKPANIVLNDGLGEGRLDTNPRLLVVGLAGDGGYRRVVANHTLVPRHIQPTLDDALEQPPEIRNGVLSVRLNFFASAGGWTMYSSTARFRWQDGDLRLIGHDYSETQRNTGDTLDRSVNFLSRRISTIRSSIEAETAPPPVWTRLPAAPLLTIDQVGDGLAFNPVPAEE